MSNGEAGDDSGRNQTVQSHKSLIKILDFILKKWKNPKGLQESGKDEGNAFGKQNELTKLRLP